MRRLTILLAAVGALMLIPAAQALAGNVIVTVAGEGNGKVTGATGYGGGEGYKTSPPVECSYAGATETTSGACSAPLFLDEEEGAEGVGLKAIPAMGSELSGWEVEAGTAYAGGCAGVEPPDSGFYECLAAVSIGEGDVEITVFFECATEGGCPNPANAGLTVTKEGTGGGTVVSNPSGIECGATCSALAEAGKVVTLTASPSAGSTFVSWKGCDKGGVNGRQCTVTMSGAKNVSAKFTKTYDVAVTREGSGLGKVSSSPGGVLCLSNCSSTSAAFKEGTSVTLSAAPSKNYVFTEWTGACSGSSTTCSLTMDGFKSVGAKFTAVPQHNLSLTKFGGGNGTVKSNLAGINCGATCSKMAAAYFQGQEVELTATPGKGSTFAGWSGSCSGTGTCKVAISEAKPVAAEFK